MFISQGLPSFSLVRHNIDEILLKLALNTNQSIFYFGKEKQRFVLPVIQIFMPLL